MLNQEPIPEHPNPLCDDCDGRGWMEDFENIRGTVRWACETCRNDCCEIVCRNPVPPCDSPERVDLYQQVNSYFSAPGTRIARDITLCSHDCTRSRFLNREDLPIESFVSDSQTLSLTLKELPADHPSREILLEIQDELNLAFEREINRLKRQMSRAQVGDQ